jgi:hypothetical protein
MPNRNPTPPPKGAGKFAIFAGAVVALIIVTLFVGMNAQHAQDSKNARLKMSCASFCEQRQAARRRV